MRWLKADANVLLTVLPADAEEENRHCTASLNTDKTEATCFHIRLLKIYLPNLTCAAPQQHQHKN
jgi:hypothetical protein